LKTRNVRTVLATSAVIAIAVPSVAVGFGEGQFLKLGKRNPSQNGTLAVSSETELIADNGTYGTRQSNKKDGDGGGAIYGCRSSAGNEPCIRANNLKGGRAFELVTVGKEAGRIEVGDTTGAPLTTNATGVATGFNADKVDGRDGADLAAAGDLLFAAVDKDGKLGAKRGAAAATIADATKGSYSVTFTRDVKDCSFTASPVGGSTAEALGVSAGTDPKTVIVDESDAATDRTGFHLQVIC
jgi:hypothetical protein